MKTLSLNLLMDCRALLGTDRLAHHLPSDARPSALFVAGLMLAMLSHSAIAADRAAGTGAATAGGGRSTGGVYANQATLGQAAGPAISGGAYQLTSGFQSRNARPAGPPPSPGAPFISVIPEQVIDEDSEPLLIPFRIGDSDTQLSQLTLTRATSNPGLIRLSDIVLGGTGSNRVVRLTPRPNQSGAAIITITVSDPQNHSTSGSFLLEVLPVNDPPMIGGIASATTTEDMPTEEIPFLVRDLETPAAELVVAGRSDNPSLLPPGAFTFGGSESNRSVRIQPAPDQSGNAMATITVSDGEAVTEMSFPFAVLPRNDPPTISPLADVIIAAGGQRTINFTVNDADDEPASLNGMPFSDNHALIPQSSLAVMGQGSRRQLTITPASGQSGEARVGLLVTDARGASASTSFRVTVTPAVAPTDFGDAPSIYPVTLARNGARHTLRPGLTLGRRADPEADGQPSADARGDDNAAIDDEDGVQLLTPLMVGQTASIAVAVNIVAGPAWLDVFFDFNDDGDWSDPGEKVFDKRSVSNGVNRLSFVVPPDATAGRTYARFRLSSTGGLGPEGAADDGEVEDYQVRIHDDSPEIVVGDATALPTGALTLNTTATGLRASGFTGPAADTLWLRADGSAPGSPIHTLRLLLEPVTPGGEGWSMVLAAEGCCNCTTNICQNEPCCPSPRTNPPGPGGGGGGGGGTNMITLALSGQADGSLMLQGWFTPELEDEVLVEFLNGGTFTGRRRTTTSTGLSIHGAGRLTAVDAQPDGLMLTFDQPMQLLSANPPVSGDHIRWRLADHRNEHASLAWTGLSGGKLADDGVVLRDARSRSPARPNITSAMRLGNRLRLRVTGEADAVLSLESSSSLGADADWRPDGTMAVSRGAEVELESDPSPTPARFYRVRAD